MSSYQRLAFEQSARDLSYVSNSSKPLVALFRARALQIGAKITKKEIQDLHLRKVNKQFRQKKIMKE